MTAPQLLATLSILLGSGVLIAALAARLRIPDVALFLLGGILLGPEALGVVQVPAASALNQLVLLCGASWLLFEGGLGLRFAVLKTVFASVAALALPGVLITAAVVAGAAHLVLGLAWLPALLLGAVLAPTDPATLVPIFQQVRIRERVAQAVVAESALNDATGAILCLVLVGVAAGGAVPGAGAIGLAFLREAGVGLLVGAALGLALSQLTTHSRRGVLAGFEPAAVLATVIGAYALASAAHGSGFMAVFVLGLLYGNREAQGLAPTFSSRDRLEHFAAPVGLGARAAIFLLLGTQVEFAVVGGVALPALAVVAAFMLLARPLAVLACAMPDRGARWSRQELLFLCWTRETGVIPAALAGMLLGQGVPGAETIAAVTSVAILATILIQAPTTRALAAKLGLLA